MAKINPAEYNPVFKRVYDEGRDRGEDNDCAVVSLSIATNVPYLTAHELLEKHGRKQKRATYSRTLSNALKELGFRAVAIEPYNFISNYPAPHNTLKNVTSHHPRRFPKVWKDGQTYLIFSRDHVWCVKDGENLDWSITRVLRVCSIWRISKEHSE